MDEKIPNQRRKRVNTDTIDVIRRAIIGHLYDDDKSNERFIKREAVRQLMGVIIAARKNGTSFEDLASIFNENGMDISGNTLRSYFFELKAESELNKETRHLADEISQTRQQLDLERTIKHGTDAHKAVRSKAKQSLASKPKIMSTEELTTYGRPPSVSPPSKTVSAEDKKTQEVGAAPLRESASPPSAAVVRDVVGAGPSIERLRELGKEAVHFELPEDIVVKNGMVYYVSGPPFDGILSLRQVRLLETSKRLVAKKPGSAGSRTDHTFIKLPDQL